MNTQVETSGTLPSVDTQAALLLCSELGTKAEVRPLTASEYNRLALHLKDNRSRPSDLLLNGTFEILANGRDLPQRDRLKKLLDRGRLLSLALTKWSDFGVWALSRADAAYPERLRGLRLKAPPLLFGVGAASQLDHGGLAVVGSREVDAEAIDFTRNVATLCAKEDVQIVSGGARGVDREAITSVLEAGGKAVAIPSENLLKVVTNRQSRTAIRSKQLVVVSPFDPETKFTVYGAKGRNKFIYALADFALVVHFKTKEGGTWAGAVEHLSDKSSTIRTPLYVRVRNNPVDGWRNLKRMGALPFPEEATRGGGIVDLLSKGDVHSVDLFSPALPSPDIESPLSLAEGEVRSSTIREHRRAHDSESNSASTCDSDNHSTEADRNRSNVLSDSAPPLTSSAANHSAVRDADERLAAPSAPTKAKTCYEYCLERILHELRTEPTKKQFSQIAARLDLLPQQLKTWIDRAIAEGKVTTKKKGRTLVFVDRLSTERETLFDQKHG